MQSAVSSFAGEPLNYRIPDRAQGSPSQAVVYDLNGDVVDRINLTPGQLQFSWDGVNSDGATAPFGQYIVEIEFEIDGEVVETGLPLVLADVTQARVVDGAARLLLSNGAFIEPEEILAVHQPPEAGVDGAAEEDQNNADGV